MLKHFRQNLKGLIQNLIQPKGDMNTANGLRRLMDIFGRQGRRGSQKVVIYVTDGTTRSLTDANRVSRLWFFLEKDDLL